MGLAIAPKVQYESAVKKLFPQGDYWDQQFAHPESDISLFTKAKLDALIHFRTRMSKLLDESRTETAGELIADWERVQLGYLNTQLPLDERRAILNASKAFNIDRKVIADIAQRHGLIFLDILFSFKCSFFGFSKFGLSIFSKPSFFSVFHIITKFQNEDTTNEAKKCVTQLLKRSSFGHGSFGIGQFLGRFYFNKFYASHVFSGMEALNNFERDVSDILLASNIAYFQYRL